MRKIFTGLGTEKMIRILTTRTDIMHYTIPGKQKAKVPPGASPTKKCPRRQFYHLSKRDTKKMSHLQRCFGNFRQLEWKFRQRDPLTKNVHTRNIRVLVNVLHKIIPKPTPSFVLYTDIVGLTQSHTERYLPWTDPNRFLYSVLAVMGYLSPILCVTATCSTSTGTCYYFLFFGRFFGRTSLWL